MRTGVLKNQAYHSTRWAARLLTLIVTAWWLVLTYAALGFDDPFDRHATISFGLALLACLGLLAAWRWPQAGGAVAVAGAIALGSVTAYYNSPPTGPALISAALLGLPLLLPGVLFLTFGRLRLAPFIAISLAVVLLILASAGVGRLT